MATPLSALEHRSPDFVREVSADTIAFFVNELSGIYLPDDFKQANAGVLDVKCWKPEDRLSGKFGRFTVRHAEEDEEGEQTELDDILVMGTTIGLHGLDRYRDMDSLRHYSLGNGIRGILGERGLSGSVSVAPADYGSTRIKLDESGAPVSLEVGSASLDFGRANAEGRLVTCGLFEQLLGTAVTIVNADPEPRERQRIIT